MVVDEPAMWNLIPEAKRERVLCAAKAMCLSRDGDDADDDDEPHCGGCDTPTGGSCVAFALYGHMALEVIEALDRASPNPSGQSETTPKGEKSKLFDPEADFVKSEEKDLGVPTVGGAILNRQPPTFEIKVRRSSNPKDGSTG